MFDIAATQEPNRLRFLIPSAESAASMRNVIMHHTSAFNNNEINIRHSTNRTKKKDIFILYLCLLTFRRLTSTIVDVPHR